MIDNKTQIQRAKLCQKADRKFYKLVLNGLQALIPSNRRITCLIV
jgi:hypothetical protein